MTTKIHPFNQIKNMDNEKKQRKPRASYAQKTGILHIRITPIILHYLQVLAATKCTTKTGIIEALIMQEAQECGIEEIIDLEAQKEEIQTRINELANRINNKNHIQPF